MASSLTVLLLLASALCVNLTTPTTHLSASDTPCCIKCDEENGYAKYFSVVAWNKMCGESCIKPSDYWKFKIFEHNLTRATNNTPCADRNFTLYEKTEAHGFGPIKVSIDFYSYNKTATT